jgi:hypothetical protein
MPSRRYPEHFSEGRPPSTCCVLKSPLLALFYDFARIRNRPYLNRSTLHAWVLRHKLNGMIEVPRLSTLAILLQACLRNIFRHAICDHFGCHPGRNHLLHDRRHDANHVLDCAHRPDYGQLDGDAGGYFGGSGRHQWRGRVRDLYHNRDRCGLRNDLPPVAIGAWSIWDATDRLHYYFDPLGSIIAMVSQRWHGAAASSKLACWEIP